MKKKNLYIYIYIIYILIAINLVSCELSEDCKKLNHFLKNPIEIDYCNIDYGLCNEYGDIHILKLYYFY